MEENHSLDLQTLAMIQQVAQEGILKAAEGLSSMLGHTIQVAPPQVTEVPLFDITQIVGGLETEATGIYLRAEGDMAGQMMLILPYKKALELVDLLMDLPNGTTTHMGALERSALGEVGNLTGTFFLNAMADMTGSSIRPTPPAVLVDMVGAILDIVIATTGGISENILLIKTNFMNNDRSVETAFWVIPDAQTIKTLNLRKLNA